VSAHSGAFIGTYIGVASRRQVPLSADRRRAVTASHALAADMLHDPPTIIAAEEFMARASCSCSVPLFVGEVRGEAKCVHDGYEGFCISSVSNTRKIPVTNRVLAMRTCRLRDWTC